MESTQKRRCSRALLIVLAIALLAYLGNSFGLRFSPIAYIVLIVLLSSVWAALAWRGIIFPFLIGNECPACGKLSMKRLARSSHYFECSRCGARRKRFFPTSPWQDVSGPEVEALFSRSSRAGQWDTYATPDPGNTMSGHLLRSKRLRDQSEFTAEPESPRDASADR